MPLPKPMSAESKDEFMSRCMSDEMMIGEYPNHDQKAAVCLSQWGSRSAAVVNRSYSLLNVRSMDDEKRIIEGMATTPSLARDGDIIEPRGIQFKLPIPFLYRHQEPFGNVFSANVSDEGIAVRIQVPPAGASASIDEYWNLVKHGVVRGLSIGWRTIKEEFDKMIGGFRITSCEWLELSAVPVPADTKATILSIRSADESILAALGKENAPSKDRVKPKPPGVSGSRKRGDEMPKKFDDQIASLETKRDEIKTRMTAIMEAADDSGKITEKEQQREYDGLITDMSDVDTDLRRLRAQKRAVEGADPLPVVPGKEEDQSQQVRKTRAQITKDERDKMPKGTGMARSVIALMKARGDYMNAARLAQEHYADTPEVALYLRAFVEAGDTTTSGWASQLVPAAQQLQNEFIDLLRPATLLGRIPNLRMVPFNVAVPLQSGGGTFNWVGESAPKPVTSITVGSATLRWSKAAGIIVITQELARFSSPSAEGIIRNEMIQGVAKFLDLQFVDSTVAEVTNVSPGSITNGISALVPTASSAGAFRYDMNRLLALFIADNNDPSTAVVLMSASTAMALSLMTNSLGQAEFPGISMAGGTIMGLPVVVSQNVGAKVILLNASDILMADDGGVTIAVSGEATVEMSTTPITGEGSPPTNAVLHSMFQRNEIAIRAERFISWKRARTSAVQWLNNVAYGPLFTSP